MIKLKTAKKLLSLVTATLMTAVLIQPVASLKAAEAKYPSKIIADYNDEDNGIYSKYDDVFEYSDGLAIVRKGSKYGYVDVNGKEVIKLKYQAAEDFNDGLRDRKSVV